MLFILNDVGIKSQFEIRAQKNLQSALVYDSIQDSMQIIKAVNHHQLLPTSLNDAHTFTRTNGS